jgi:hypothetical protein
MTIFYEEGNRSQILSFRLHHRAVHPCGVLTCCTLWRVILCVLEIGLICVDEWGCLELGTCDARAIIIQMCAGVKEVDVLYRSKREEEVCK